MSDDHHHVDELGKRAATAVRERAEQVARRSDREPLPRVRRLRPVSKRLMTVAAALAITGGAVAFVTMARHSQPPTVSVQPVAPPSGEVEHAQLQQEWVEQVCVPATGDTSECERFAKTEAWPWHSDDPLSDLEQRYSQRDFCDGIAFSEAGRNQCEALSRFYHARTGTSSTSTDGSAVPELLDSGTQSAWYMTAEGYHEGVEGRHDEVCTWARQQISDFEPVPAHVDGSAHRALHDAINVHLTYPSDGLPIAVGGVCGLLVWSPDTWFQGFEPQWWDSPPYPWQQEGPTPAPDVDDLLNDLLTMPTADAPEPFRDERQFAEQADRIGGPDVLCRWVQARIPKDVFQEVGVTWETAAAEFRDAVMRWLPADAPALGEALSYTCGYLDPYVAEQDGRWWVDPPYLWGRWLLSPPMQYQIAGHSDYAPVQP